jgi:hypothetical protein
LSDIFDPNFVPVTPEAIELFGEKQKFVFAVFDKILLTDKGKSLVRHYAKTSDAQKVFCDLSLYASSPTMANMEAEDLLKYITSIRFGDGMWKGTAHGFILNWQDKVRQYESILPVKDHFTATVKCNMLENAVRDVIELHAVNSQAAHHQTNCGVALTYEKYVGLLSSAAQEYDKGVTRSVKTPSSGARRPVYYSELEPSQFKDEIFDTTFDMIPAPMTCLKSMSIVLEALGSMLINGVVCQRKHKRNGTSWMENTRPSFSNTSSGRRQEAAHKDLLPDATLEDLWGAVLSPGTA